MVPNQGMGVYKGHATWGETKPSQVKVPSEMIALGDSNWDLKRKGDRNWSGFIGMYEERQWPLPSTMSAQRSCSSMGTFQRKNGSISPRN